MVFNPFLYCVFIIPQVSAFVNNFLKKILGIFIFYILHKKALKKLWFLCILPNLDSNVRLRQLLNICSVAKQTKNALRRF